MSLPAYQAEYEFEAMPELEEEFESGRDGEFEVNPMRKIYPDAAEALTEHMAHMAAEAESEQEAAEQFLPLIPMVAGRLLPLAARALPRAIKALPRIARAVQRATPLLTRGVSTITRALFRNQRTRPMVHAIPNIARRTVASIVRQAAAGRPVTPHAARRMLVQQTRRAFSNPRQIRYIVRRSHLLDGHAHRMAGSLAAPVTGVPAGGVSIASTWSPRLGPCRCGSTARPAPVCCRYCGQLLIR